MPHTKQGNSGAQGQLNDRKERAAGRVEQNPQMNPALDPDYDVEAKGRTAGAFGKEDQAHRNTTAEPGSGGGGGGGGNTRSDLGDTSPAKGSGA